MKIRFKNLWKITWPNCKKYGSLIAIVISLFALANSYKQTYIAEESREDYIALQKLEIDPRIQFNTRFKQGKEEKAFSILTNLGPVNIVQVEIKSYELLYDPNFKDFRIAITNNNYNFKEIAPKASKILNWGNGLGNLHRATSQYRKYINYAFQIELSYMREADLKQYKKAAFYFINKEGEFLSEARVIGEDRYKVILEAVYRNTFTKSIQDDQVRWSSDILHEWN